MNAVNWLRTRQEEHELTYWLSIVSYDKKDRSFNNRIYLFYLILFFSVWIFVTLTFFAGVGALLLRLFNANQPAQAALLCEVLVLGIWNIFALRAALKRSPVIFSEQDATLICQMPVDHRQVTLRWFLMPWLKSAIPFWLMSITIGFSLAEIGMAGAINAGHIFAYAGYGLRAWAAMLPVHLALFAFQWVIGVYFLQKDLDRRQFAWPVMIFAIVLSSLAVFSLLYAGISDPFVKTLFFPLLAGFGTGSLLPSLLPSGILAVALLGLLYGVSGSFSLSRAAQETQGWEVIHTALQYGFTSYAESLQTQNRLGVRRAPSRMPALAGAGILVWKDILQSRRSFRLGSLGNWFTIFAIMLGLSLLPDLASITLAMFFWGNTIEKVSVIRLRNDLSCWPLTRQLPISYRKFLIFELGLAYLLSVMVSSAGLGLSAALFHTQIHSSILLIPGMVAGVAGIAALDVIRHSRSNLLLNGSVPNVNAGGILLGVLFAVIPLYIYVFLPGIIGLILSILVSLFLGFAAFRLALHAYRNIGDSG